MSGQRSALGCWDPFLCTTGKSFGITIFSSPVSLASHLACHISRQLGQMEKERSIIDAPHQQFSEAQYLRCFRHLQKVIERHLQAQGFPIFLQQQFHLEIFGETDESGTHKEGLVDCKDEDSLFDALSELKGAWNSRERRAFGQDQQPLTIGSASTRPRISVKVHSVSHESWLALDVHHCHITRIPMNPSTAL